ncbi:MAG: leucyl aminopeptidase family protein [Alphaproteobacteria bacterium]|nr:leucyl aminopeptidase family protein [Alphaproteobacteria bacterium]
MADWLVETPDETATPLIARTEKDLDEWLAQQSPIVADWVAGSGFKAKPATHCLIPDGHGKPVSALCGVDPAQLLWSWAGLRASLPHGIYRFDSEISSIQCQKDPESAALGWALGGYRFSRYQRDKGSDFPQMVWPQPCDRARVRRLAEAIFLIRDLINTPANELGPAELANAIETVAKRFNADVKQTIGDDLLESGYPAIHAVGHGSPRAPRLIDLTWGEADAPLITLVGKGVCFDTGGLDIKPAAAMKLMKKDMGGAAHALGLAMAIMDAQLPVRLRLLIPAVENSVSGNALRPQDVISTRKGLSVEIGNTDAEGRLILADALAEAASQKPRFIIDFATLTGAARVALGPSLPALFCNRNELAEDLLHHGEAVQDPVWRMPLFDAYRKLIDGKIADLNNAPEVPFAGAITAALFLEAFVEPEVAWAHMDIMAWNLETQPGRPEGGEAMGVRAAYAMIATKFS